MTQIFSPSADTWLRLFLAGGARRVGGGLVVVVAFARSDYLHGRQYPPAGAAGAVQPPASRRRARHRLPLLPHLRGRRPARRPAADAHLHDLPFADLDQRADAGAGARRALPTTSRWCGIASRGCRTTSISATTSISPRASAASPATAASTSMPLMVPRHRRSRWNSASTAIATRRRTCGRAIRSPTWTGSRRAMRARSARSCVKQNGIRVGQLDYCYVCHR